MHPRNCTVANSKRCHKDLKGLILLKLTSQYCTNSPISFKFSLLGFLKDSALIRKSHLFYIKLCDILRVLEKVSGECNYNAIINLGHTLRIETKTL